MNNHDIDRERVWRKALPGFLRFFVPLISFFCLIIVFNFTIDVLYEKELLLAKQQQQTQMSLQSLQRDITGIVRELRYMVGSDSLQRYIYSRDPRQTRRAAADIANFAQRMDRYDQIRWLDADGMERLRVDHRDGKTRIVPAAELQDKSARYYYKEAIVLPPGSIYVSPLDLNIEHGAVEEPHRPMLRFATPTVDAQGMTNGLVIFNYQASIMLDNFAATLHTPRTELALLNAQSYWFYSSADNPAWAFMFDRDERFAKHKPLVWQEIESHTEGMLDSQDGLYTYTSFAAADFSMKLDSGDSKQHTARLAPLNRERWIIVTYTPQSAMSAINDKHFNNYVVLLLLSFIVLALLSWRNARADLEKALLLDRLGLHATVMENATNGVMITDRDNRIVSVNNAFTELTGYTEDEVIGKDPSILASDKHDETYFANMWLGLEERGHWEGELWNRHKNGELYPEWVSITSVLDHNGELSNYIGIFSLLSEQKSTEARLRELANSDSLTGLINRNLFMDRVTQALAAAMRSNYFTAILFLDLDGFKPINDSLGHLVGDAVLRDIARRMQESVRGSDTVARFGGDEFVILLTGLKDVDEAGTVAGKLIETVSRPLVFSGVECRVGVSIGIAISPADAVSADALIKCADVAMYAAKEGGRGRFRFYRDIT